MLNAFIPNPCDHRMFQHLRFNGSVVESRTDAGNFTVSYLDLNDPEVVEYRNLIILAIATFEEKKTASEALSKQIRIALDAGSIDASQANLDLAEIATKINELDKRLSQLTGRL